MLGLGDGRSHAQPVPDGRRVDIIASKKIIAYPTPKGVFVFSHSGRKSG